MEIIPAILTDSPDELREKVALITKANRHLVRRVQIDVIDGVFANNKTVGLEPLEGLDTDLLFDIQLMVKNPVGWVKKSAEVLADRIIGHVEQMPDQSEFVNAVTLTGCEVGLGLDIHTPIKAIEDVLSDLDVVLLMSVETGFGGQELDPDILDKIVKLKEMRDTKDHRYQICVDGGVSEKNIYELGQAGADEVAIGRSLWSGDGFEERVEGLLRIVGEEVN